MARYGLSRLTLHTEALIWTTVGINLVGSFLLGLLAAEQWFTRDLREALGVGFLGGFTTFSTFSVQVVLEVDAGNSRKAGVHAHPTSRASPEPACTGGWLSGTTKSEHGVRDRHQTTSHEIERYASLFAKRT